MGSNIDNESPIKRLSLDDYCIDTYEYPNVKGAYPQVNVDWQQAELLCEEIGKRLCAENEWEKACRGPLGNWFTYGTFTYNPDVCGVEINKYQKLFPAGHFPGCKSYYGVYDMNGSVYEWTASSYAPYPGNKTEMISPQSFWEKSIRSAGFTNGKESYCSHRQGLMWNQAGGYLGFRCCTSFSEAENTRIKENIWQEFIRY